jgi:hypothetical protein
VNVITGVSDRNEIIGTSNLSSPVSISLKNIDFWKNGHVLTDLPLHRDIMMRPGN